MSITKYMPSLKDDLQSVKENQQCNVADICTALGITTSACKVFVAHALANAMLMERKQRDYGPRNISGFGTFGVVVRMNDKHERLKTLFAKKKNRAVNESIEDTLRDISNYAIIASMIERGEWPNE